MAKNALSSKTEILSAVAKKYEATHNQIAIAWLLQRSSVILPIPGTSKISHFEENMLAGNITLSNEDFNLLDASFKDLAVEVKK